MTQRIVEREVMEAIELMTEDLNELNYMIQNLNTDLSTIRLFFAEQRRARENGKNND
jgi:hypothetical protein